MNKCLVLVALGFLLGCVDSEQAIEANAQWVTMIKSRPPGRIEPIPELLPLENLPKVVWSKRLFWEVDENNLVDTVVVKECIDPENYNYPYKLAEISVEKLSIIGKTVAGDDFSVVVWDGKSTTIVYKDSWLGKEKLLVHQLSEQRLHLATLDECSQVANEITLALNVNKPAD